MITIKFQSIESELCRLSESEHFYSATASNSNWNSINRVPLLHLEQSLRFRIYVKRAVNDVLSILSAWCFDVKLNDENVEFSLSSKKLEQYAINDIQELIVLKSWFYIIHHTHKKESIELTERIHILQHRLICKFL